MDLTARHGRRQAPAVRAMRGQPAFWVWAGAAVVVWAGWAAAAAVWSIVRALRSRRGFGDLLVLLHALLERLDALGDVAHQIGNLALPPNSSNATAPTTSQCQIDIEPMEKLLILQRPDLPASVGAKVLEGVGKNKEPLGAKKGDLAPLATAPGLKSRWRPQRDRHPGLAGRAR